MADSPALTLHKLAPDPTAEWRQLLDFMILPADARLAMAMDDGAVAIHAFTVTPRN